MFELKRSGDEFHWVLNAKNGEPILSSQMYGSKQAAKVGITSVKKNSRNLESFDKRLSSDYKPYFVMLAKNHKVIATSETYNSLEGRETGIRAVMLNAPDAETKEIQ